MKHLGNNRKLYLASFYRTDRIYAAPGIVDGLDRQVSGLENLIDILEEAIGDVFLIYSNIPVDHKVILEGFKFQATFIGDIFNYDRGNVRQSGKRAHG